MVKKGNPRNAASKHLLKYSLLLAILVHSSNMLFAQSNEESTDSASPAKGKFTGAMDSDYPDWFKTSFLELADDVNEATEQGKRLMLLFHQDGCPYCNAFVERNLAQKDISEILQTKFDVIDINMWGEREVGSVNGDQYTEKTFAALLKVQFTPTVIFLNEAGDVALRINGYYDPDKFRLALKYIAEKRERTESFKEFLSGKLGEKSPGKLSQHSYLTGPITELNERPGKSVRPLLVMFEQNDCSNCQTLQQKVFSEQESLRLLEKFDVYQVNLWGNEAFVAPDGQKTTGRQWGMDLGISYAPTLVLYASTGEEVIRSEAWFKRFHTQSILDYVASDSWREQPSFQRYISARADALREQGIDVNIWD